MIMIYHSNLFKKSIWGKFLQERYEYIFFLDEGQINGFGTHQELLQNNKIYKEVFESQQTAGDADMADNSEVE